ncbi:MAG: hypothetical protein IJF00_02570 [Bacteroidaceae bacterium]|nr:hypothetical protein [Bacteroidaceae bacterium]
MMTENDISTLEYLEENLYRLKQKYQDSVKRNRELAGMLYECNAELKTLQERYDELRQNYNNLKQAKVISLSDSEIELTRDRLTRLVREIDRCIESLTNK